jgi:hypothetical protein
MTPKPFVELRLSEDLPKAIHKLALSIRRESQIAAVYDPKIA